MESVTKSEIRTSQVLFSPHLSNAPDHPEVVFHPFYPQPPRQCQLDAQDRPFWYSQPPRQDDYERNVIYDPRYSMRACF